MATTVRVALRERSYEIEIGRGLLARGGAIVRARLPEATHAIVIADSNVAESHGRALAQSLAASGMRCDVVCVAAGEQAKCVSEAEKLWNRLGELKADRKSIVVAVGGGVVGDLAGFVAATYARGLTFIQAPTTLLAQVDSSVGGKVGINLPSAKNIVGAFWQPAAVLIDLDALATLPRREYVSGLAEVVKYGVILDEQFFAYLEEHAEGLLKREPEALEHIVARSCRLKADVVEQDEREETGLRAILNYGHTFCHAIETVSGYGRFLHGEAVSIGMDCAARLAQKLGRVDGQFVARQRQLLERLQLPVAVADLDKAELLAAMSRDKKSEHGRLKFVLPRKLGAVELVGGIDPAMALAVLEPEHPIATPKQ